MRIRARLLFIGRLLHLRLDLPPGSAQPRWSYDLYFRAVSSTTRTMTRRSASKPFCCASLTSRVVPAQTFTINVKHGRVILIRCLTRLPRVGFRDRSAKTAIPTSERCSPRAKSHAGFRRFSSSPTARSTCSQTFAQDLRQERRIEVQGLRGYRSCRRSQT